MLVEYYDLIVPGENNNQDGEVDPTEQNQAINNQFIREYEGESLDDELDQDRDDEMDLDDDTTASQPSTNVEEDQNIKHISAKEEQSLKILQDTNSQKLQVL